MIKYDVFISYNSDYKGWIEILAKNLKSQKFRVFLDDWEFIAGNLIVEEMNRGIEQSKNGIFLVTHKAKKSGWVKNEYYKMLELYNKRGFKIIPIILEKDISEIPFVNNFKCVDFSDDRLYRQSFRTLICALNGEAPGVPKDFQGDLEIPTSPLFNSNSIVQSGREIAEDIFNILHTKQSVLLFEQRDRVSVVIDSYLYERAKKRYGSENLLNFVPPLLPINDLSVFYSEWSKKNKLDNCTGPVDFKNAIEKRLKNTGKLCIIVTCFEHCDWNVQKSLASIFRSLNEENGRKISIIICGGEKLAELANHGELSYLNHAEKMDWPEMNLEEVYEAHQKIYPNQSLSESIASELLEVSNGHMWLLEKYIVFRNSNLTEELSALNNVLIFDRNVFQLFSPYLEDKKKKNLIRQLLQEETIAPSSYRYSDPLVKKLYWDNLLMFSSNNKNLTWRPFFKKAGLHYFGMS